MLKVCATTNGALAFLAADTARKQSTQDLRHEAAGSPGAQPQPADGSPVAGSGRAGVVALVTVAVAYPVLWVLARPGGQPLGRFLAELCGAEAVLLFSCWLVLATLLAPIERAGRPR